MERSAPPSSTVLGRAGRFVWLTARVLEQRRFAYHFLDGDADPVETALAAYRGADGGYGHALDPDVRGPVSQPAHTAHALRVLDGIDRCRGQRVEQLCRYLTAVSTQDGALPSVHPSLHGYPAAPWRQVSDAPRSDLLATGPVVGLLHRNQVWHAWLFRATDFCWAAVAALERAARARPYEIQAAVDFLDGAPDRTRAARMAERLGRLVRERRLAVLDPQDADAEAHPSPDGGGCADRRFVHDYARTPESLGRRWFTEAEVERSLDFLAGAQQEDGGWPARGQSWAPGASLETRPIETIEALLTLRAYGRAV